MIRHQIGEWLSEFNFSRASMYYPWMVMFLRKILLFNILIPLLVCNYICLQYLTPEVVNTSTNENHWEKKKMFATTYTIFYSKEYFSNLTLCKVNVHTISSPVKIIRESRNATRILPNCTILHLEDVLLSNISKKNLLSFKDIHQIGYNFKTIKYRK